MIKEKGSFMKFVHGEIGGGGWHCYCCQPGWKSKKCVMRALKKRYRRRIDRQVEKEYYEEVSNRFDD